MSEVKVNTKKVRVKTQANIDSFYNFIKNYIITNGFPPSFREMRDVLGNSSTSTVFSYILKLEKLNLIKRPFGKNRALELVERLPSKNAFLIKTQNCEYDTVKLQELSNKHNMTKDQLIKQCVAYALGNLEEN